MPRRMIAAVLLCAALGVATATTARAQSVADADHAMRAMDLRLRALITSRKTLQQMEYHRGDDEADAARDVADADASVFADAVKVFTVAFFVTSIKSPDDFRFSQQQFRLVVGLFVTAADGQLSRINEDIRSISAPAAVAEATSIRNVIVDLRDFLKPFAAQE
jgi:hypothetical protein